MHPCIRPFGSALFGLLCCALPAHAQLLERPDEPDSPAQFELPRIAISIGSERFDAELAQDDATRTRGLMFRTALGKRDAMLFVFDEEQPLAFWMKNTHIALDILYFDAAGTLVSAQRDVPPCRVARCPVYPSERAARFVVEVAAGTSTRLGIRKGAQLCWEAGAPAPPAGCARKS